jgi:hypothetical protein
MTDKRYVHRRDCRVQKHYVSHAKQIAFRSVRAKIAKEEPYLNIQETPGNFDLVFSEDGRLLESIHLDTGNPFSIVYVYSKKRLIRAIKLNRVNNEIIEISEFTYDDRGKRIVAENWRSFIGVILDGGDTEVRIHKYDKNKETICITSSFHDFEAFFYKTYNDKNLLVEEKAIRGTDDLMYWSKFRYGPDQDLVEEISLDEDGKDDGVYQFAHHKTGVSTGYTFQSEQRSYVKEYVYVFNKKDHWINKIVLTNGEPGYSYERTIEYY